MNAFNDLLSSKTLYIHLIIRVILFCLFVGACFIFLIPLIYWAIVGEGSVGDGITSSPLNTFIINYLALIIGIVLAAVIFYLHIKNNNFSKAKSYVIAGAFVILIYPFKEKILDLIFYTFQ
jgi:TRAP-type C4-dicarboxylate transport system permease small subunit